MMFDKPTSRSCRPVLGLALFVSLSGIGLLSAPAARSSDPRPGEAIFLTRCASCHGVRGEGTKRYSKALAGDKSVGQLARFIQQSMPPGPTRKWVGDDA